MHKQRDHMLRPTFIFERIRDIANILGGAGHTEFGPFASYDWCDTKEVVCLIQDQSTLVNDSCQNSKKRTVHFTRDLVPF